MSQIEQQAEQLITMAEDELTQYSTEARKIEKLRRKLGFMVPYREQAALREAVMAQIPKNFVAQMVERDRQMVALPFWGIGGLGLLLGISWSQPLDLIATFVGFYIAFSIQQWGWRLEAKRLVTKTIDAIAADMRAEQTPEQSS